MLGGALGSALRYGLSLWIMERVPTAFPWGTFAVNVIGSFVIGLVIALGTHSESIFASPMVRNFLVVGVLGGFTTFSSFSLQTCLLLQDGRWSMAVMNIVASLTVCLLATGAAMFLVHTVVARN